MKTLIITFFLTFSAYAAQLESGLYECKEGNNPSICSQKIKVKMFNGKLSALSVYYSDYCNDQGPFEYSCNDNGICEDANIRFTVKNATEYFWENLGYDFNCHFKKK